MGPIVAVLLIAASTLTASKKTSFKYAVGCSECITANEKTSWCAGMMPPGALRCHLKSELIGSGCSEADIISPDPVHLTITKYKPLRSKRPIGPQKINLELRRGASATLPVEVLSKKKSISIKFKYPRAVKIQVQSNCTGFKWKDKTATCGGRSKIVQLEVIAKLKRCLPKPKKIKLIVNENRKHTLKISLLSRCTCDCEKEGTPKDPHCRGQGTYTCGTCQCNRGFFGPNCQCHGSELNEDNEKLCKSSRNSTVCSGRGICVCGECECFFSLGGQQKYSGQYCQCDDSSCERHDGKLCGGSERGKCQCGQCVCKPGYRGSACQDSMSAERCSVAESIPDSPKCSSQGTLSCGQCTCNPGYYGEFCECDPGRPEEACKLNQNDTVVCSGRGSCVCGICDCFTTAPGLARKYSGRYCECDDWSCDYFDGELCGGPERGVCRCGQCQCKQGFVGPACELSTATDKCRGIFSPELICNGHGRCINNVCMCEGFYRGPTCEECPTCPDMCTRLRPCVECRVFNTGPYTPEVCHSKCKGRVDMVDAIDGNNRHARLCRFADEDGCRFHFTYNPEDGNKIQAQITKEC